LSGLHIAARRVRFTDFPADLCKKYKTYPGFIALLVITADITIVYFNGMEVDPT
jgi:hypothetical protein